MPHLKGYSSGQSHFSDINIKLAEKNEFATHFVQKCLETRENEQNAVLDESSEALGNRSESVRILVLAMTTADDDASGSDFVSEVVVRFSLFYKQNGTFWLAKSKAINFSFKAYFDRSICSFQRLAGQKNPPRGGGVLGSSFAGYVPLAFQNPNAIIVYSVANYRTHLSHFLVNVIVISRTELNASRLLNIKTTAGTIFQPRIFLFLNSCLPEFSYPKNPENLRLHSSNSTKYVTPL